MAAKKKSAKLKGKKMGSVKNTTVKRESIIIAS